MNRRFALLSIVAVLSAAVPASLRAHPGHEHQVLGTVRTVAPDHVTVTDRAAKEVTVHVDAGTRIVKDGKPMTLADVKVGMRVAITALSTKDKDGEKMLARSIALGSAPAAH